ncbi:MAG TPA: DUF1801 domain-containing protein [Actinomycetota bacterium]|nr:DUF1801 domain-containing protein [Actinomycetota bacterium]
MPSKKNETSAKDVDRYLAKVPPQQRAALEKLRKTIRTAAPKATEGISYSIPAFRIEGRPFIWYAAWSNHCSLYPLSDSVVKKHARRLKGYSTAKGTIRFPPDKPLPDAFVRDLVRQRMAETLAGASTRR